MFRWLQQLRTKQLAKKQARKDEQERCRLLHEEERKRCAAGCHDWEVTEEVQGDGDPNVEGYILVTQRVCQFCGLTDLEIEPYGDDDDE